jgi:uncharacterized protein YbcI
MEALTNAMAQQIADAATSFQLSQTGHAPESVTVVMDQETLVITLNGALSPAERILARTATGAALVQEYHRQLFAGSSDALRHEITRITGIEVREAAAEVEPASGVVMHAFTTGTMVQVFHLARQPKTDAIAEGAVPPTDFNCDAGNFAGSTTNKPKEQSCPPTVRP